MGKQKPTEYQQFLERVQGVRDFYNNNANAIQGEDPEPSELTVFIEEVGNYLKPREG